MFAAVLLSLGLRSGAAATASLIVRGPIPVGSRVELSPLGEQGESRIVTLEGAGRSASFAGLAGEYSLSVILASGESSRVEVVLRVDETTVVRFPGADEGWSLEVTGRVRSGEGKLFDAALLRDLPSNRNIFGLPETVDAVAVVDRMDNGGLYGSEPGLVGAHGTSWTQTSFQLDGIDITDPSRLGTPLLVPDIELLSAVDLGYGAAPGDIRDPGARFTLVPRRHGERWVGAAQAYWTPAGLQSERDVFPPNIARYSAWNDASLTGSGPLGERTGLTLAGRYTRADRLERFDPTELRSRLFTLSGSLVSQIGDGTELRVLGAFGAGSSPYAGRARFASRDVVQDERYLHLQSTWQRRPAAGHAWSVSAGVSLADFDPDTSGRAGSSVERLLDGPVPSLFEPGRSVTRLDLSGRFEPDIRGWHDGRHRLSLGASVSRGSASYDPLATPDPVAELLDGSAARVWEITAPLESRRHLTDFSLFATDRFAIGSSGFLEAGLRFDATSGSADGAAEGISWSQLSPRLAVRFGLLADGRLTFMGSAGRYRHRLGLSHLAWGDPAAASGANYLWDDRNGDAVFQPDERGVLVSRIGPGAPDGALTEIDPSLAPPFTEEVFLGLESRLSDTWTARLVAFARREKSLVETVNVGVPESAYSLFFVSDPGGDLDGSGDDQLLPVYDRDPASFGKDRYLLTNPEEHQTTHESVEFTLARRFGSRFWVLFGATAAQTKGSPGNQGYRTDENEQGVVGELFDNPNADTFKDGRLFFDRAYTMSGSAIYRGEGDWRAAVVTRYQDGQNFARLVIQDLNQGPTAIRGVPNSRHRFTFALNMDLRLEKGFRFGERRLALIAEGFNVLDTSNEVEEDVVTGPAFRTETALQPGRAFRFGLRLDF